MSEILRDPMWQFIGVIATVVIAAISILLIVRNQMRKSFGFQVVTCAPVLSFKEEIREKLQVLYDGRPIKQAQLCVVRFINSGNVSILPNDYTTRLSLTFGKKAQVLTSEIIEQNPPNLGMQISVDSKKVLMSPSMLNRGDSFTVRSVVTDYEDVSVDGRIVGVEEIKKFVESSSPPTWILLLMMSFMTTGVTGFLGLSLSWPPASSNYLSVFSALIVVSLLLMIPMSIWAVLRIFRRSLEKRKVYVRLD